MRLVTKPYEEAGAVGPASSRLILGSHLPAAGGDLTDRLLGNLAAPPSAPAFAGPDQRALEQTLRGVAA